MTHRQPTASGQNEPFRRPRIKRTIEPIENPNGDLTFMRVGAEDVRVEEASDQDRRLIGALDGTHSLQDLEQEFGASQVRDAIDQLRDWSLLEDAADEDRIRPAEIERLDRQLRYFSDVAQKDRPTPAECQQRLRDARVAVLGAGGLGGRIAYELACMGVGDIRLIDGDRVEMSNLNRQIQYTEADIGSPKAEVMAERLRAFNSSIRVSAACERLESQEDIAEFIEGATFVVGAADEPAFVIEHWCNAACFEARIPYIALNQLPPLVRIGPIYVPGQTGCFECSAIRYRREYPLFDVAIDQRRGVEPEAATLGPASGFIGGAVGMEVLHFLTGVVEPAALGAAQTFDFRTMTVDRELVIQEKDCHICGST